MKSELSTIISVGINGQQYYQNLKLTKTDLKLTPAHHRYKCLNQGSHYPIKSTN